MRLYKTANDLLTSIAEELGGLPTRAPIIDTRKQKVNVIQMNVEGAT